jgi:hypothetical protein
LIKNLSSSILRRIFWEEIMCQSFVDDIWINENFGNADFRDERLSKRVCIIAKQMAYRPEGSIPQQMDNWNDTKACYNFLRNPKVNHKKIQKPHRERVIKRASDKKEAKTVLFLQDTSEIDYTNLECTEDLGFIGNHNNKGLLFHSCLAIEANEINPIVLGLANQQVWRRKDVSLNKEETRAERNKRSRESEVWLKNLKSIGFPPEGCKWVSIGDRANDIFEFFDGSKKMGWETVVRVSQNRCIEVDEEQALLITHMRSLESQGIKTIKARKEGDTKPREIDLNISWEEVTIQPPGRLGKKVSPIVISVIRCWNKDEGLEWILYSSICVNTLEEAIEKIEWYAKRWIIEEYHKCLKTGCRIESSQLESSGGLENLLAVLGIIALLMLQLRNMARDDVDRPASEFVGRQAIQIISKRYKQPLEMSVRDFLRSVARLGGFLGRKSDGEPGWQTLWKGWLRLLDMLFGFMCFDNALS